MGDRLCHKIVYIPERNDAVGKIEPLRLLISEDKLIRRVTKNIGGKNVTKKYVARGPVASISTTTKKQLQIDDETRHISISIDETAEQTLKIAKSYTRQTEGLSEKELRTWHMVQRLLEKRMGIEITLPDWFDKVADRLPVGDLRVRRYFPAFIEACRTVCLIRSFQRPQSSKENRLTVDFADFAMAAFVFDRIFVGSLSLRKGVNESTRDLIARLSARRERPVGAKHVARELRISMDRAQRMLRTGAAAGVIERANEPEKGNRKLYVAVPPPRFVPDPKRLFRKLRLKKTVRIIHPITGEEIVYRRKK
jgi:predicted transcriptional regulator